MGTVIDAPQSQVSKFVNHHRLESVVSVNIKHVTESLRVSSGRGEDSFKLQFMSSREISESVKRKIRVSRDNHDSRSYSLYV